MGSSDVSISKLSKIAETLDVTIEDILSFEGDRYFNSFNNVKGSNNGAIVIQVENKELKSLYEEKYRFLNKILRQTENELQKYKDRFGDI
jgi:transcriptional regulatory protein LevR